MTFPPRRNHPRDRRTALRLEAVEPGSGRLSRVFGRPHSTLEPRHPAHPDGGRPSAANPFPAAEGHLQSDPPGTAGHGHTDAAPEVISPDAATGRGALREAAPAPLFSRP